MYAYNAIMYGNLLNDEAGTDDVDVMTLLGACGADSGVVSILMCLKIITGS